MGIFQRLFGDSSIAFDAIHTMSDAVSREVASRMAEKLEEEFTALREVESAAGKVIELQKQIATLNAEKANIEEGFNRKEREIEHKTGLLRLEIEAEQKQVQKAFELRVQEAKLEAKAAAMKEKEEAFTEKMNFIQTRFTDEVGYLKDMVKQMSDRLPDAAILATKVL